MTVSRPLRGDRAGGDGRGTNDVAGGSSSLSSAVNGAWTRSRSAFVSCGKHRRRRLLTFELGLTKRFIPWQRGLGVGAKAFFQVVADV